MPELGGQQECLGHDYVVNQNKAVLARKPPKINQLSLGKLTT